MEGHVDFHEQGIGAPYYFALKLQTFSSSYYELAKEFQTMIGRNSYLMQKDGYILPEKDLFYPSYGDTNL